MPHKTKIIKRRKIPTFEIVTNKKAPPRETTPKSFWRDLTNTTYTCVFTNNISNYIIYFCVFVFW